jgi:hypothetical protein
MRCSVPWDALNPSSMDDAEVAFGIRRAPSWYLGGRRGGQVRAAGLLEGSRTMSLASSVLLVDDHGLVRHGLQLLLQEAMPQPARALADSLAASHRHAAPGGPLRPGACST